MPQVFYSNKHPNLTINVIDCSSFFFLFFVFSNFFSSISKFTSSSATCLKKELFSIFHLVLMLLFIIMNMSNYRVYFMRQSASAPGGKVPSAHCDPSAPITGRPRPSCTVRAMSFVVLAHCHPSTPIGVPSVPNCVPSSPSHLPSAHTGTSPRPFAFRPHVQEEVRARCLRSAYA
jgi:hypothetical protein